ncbi:hypothetical protein N665_1197s0002 [Sinapis alba]|nr:hypothetical protein N665_1197s0002 [Sinapis alba]
MFPDKLGVTMEVYIDDMLVKSLIAKDHIKHLSECFDTLNKYGMKLNPANSVLIQEDRGEQHPIFYTSKRLTDAEMRYPTLERMALANANQSGRLSKWAIELSEYGISYKSRPAIKAQVLADFIVKIQPDQAADLDIPVKSWILYVDGASSNKGSGIGVHLQSPIGEPIEQSFRLGFAASNNEAEYEALIAGLRLAKGVGAKRLQAFCDSQLITSQYSGDYEAKNERMNAYLGVVRKLTSEFDNFELFEVLRKDNCFADALAALGSNQREQVRRTIPIHTIENPSISLPVGKDVLAISSIIAEIAESTTQNVDWRTPFLDYLDKGIVPEDKWESRRLKVKSSNYVSIDGKLHRWTANKVLLTCVGKGEAELVMIETHEGEEAITVEAELSR